MAGFDNQVKYCVRLVLMKGKPNVVKPKLNEVIGMKKILTVSDLINELRKYDSDKPVILGAEGQIGKVLDVEEYDDGIYIESTI